MSAAHDRLLAPSFGMVPAADVEHLVKSRGRAIRISRYALRRCEELETALRALADRCDGPEGVRADGSNIDTLAARSVLGDLVESTDEECEP